MREFINSQGDRLFVQRNSEVLDILASRQPVPETAPPISSKLQRISLWLLLLPILLIVFVMFGEMEETGDVQPATTMPPPHQPSSDLPWQQ
jgi:hypothetical protein